MKLTSKDLAILQLVARAGEKTRIIGDATSDLWQSLSPAGRDVARAYVTGELPSGGDVDIESLVVGLKEFSSRNVDFRPPRPTAARGFAAAVDRYRSNLQSTDSRTMREKVIGHGIADMTCGQA